LLERILPNRNANGWLYGVRERPRAKNSATLYLYMVSDENSFHVHETVFNSKIARTPTQWAAWLKRNAFKGSKSQGTPFEVLGAIKGVVIPSVNQKTGMMWRVKEYLGFKTDDIHKPFHSQVSKKRRKTKSQRKSSGQNHIRRRHRNSRRKA
jgi:hypothetical protein